MPGTERAKAAEPLSRLQQRNRAAQDERRSAAQWVYGRAIAEPRRDGREQQRKARRGRGSR